MSLISLHPVFRRPAEIPCMVAASALRSSGESMRTLAPGAVRLNQAHGIDVRVAEAGWIALKTWFVCSSSV